MGVLKQYDNVVSIMDSLVTFAYNDIEMNWEKYREWYKSKVEK